MKYPVILLVALLSSICPTSHLSAQPNIVFIIADDLGWADVGFHGGNAPTPNLDKLATEGLELTQHYVAPSCSPTRVGLLTGRTWSRFGITTPTNTLALPPGTVTLANALGLRGYQTCLVGKWHLGSRPEWGPNHHGFDHSYGSLAGGVTAWSHRYKEGPFSITWHRNEQLLQEEGHVTDLLTTEAVSWIGQRSNNKPFLLYVPYTAVHLPINEPDEWVEKVPETITTDIARHYAACVMHLDDGVGRILDALDQKRFRENTIVVFTSDNGGSKTTNTTQPYPPDDSPKGNLTASNHPLRGGKGQVYEGGTRVPTLVSWPGKIVPRKETTPVSIVDWMPTFCQWAGYAPTKDLKWDGVSLSALLIERTPLPERAIYTPGGGWKSISLRLGDWKLVVSGESKRELFNISTDPSETTDLATTDPERLQSLLRRLQQARAGDNDRVATR